MKTVTLFQDFKEDHRTSMEIYADNLTASLNEIDQTDFSFKNYRPELGNILRYLPEKANLKMRAARYISYPAQANKNESDINHIIDHGYAHLMSKLNPAKTIITVHDIIPILAGKGLITGVTDQKRAHLAEWTSDFYKRAARIIAISESTKHDLVKYCGCDEKKITVIHPGINRHYKQLPDKLKTALREKLNLPTHKHLILTTGDAFYKNLKASLQVMEVLQKRYGEEIILVHLGRKSASWIELVKRSPCREQIIEIEHMAGKNMPSLYNAIDCLIFPSLYEGFGLPPIESMACGSPAVVSNIASLPEAAGDGAITVEPDDIDSFATNIINILEDETFRNAQIERGLKHIKKFSWNNTAKKTLKTYSEM